MGSEEDLIDFVDFSILLIFEGEKIMSKKILSQLHFLSVNNGIFIINTVIFRHECDPLEQWQCYCCCPNVFSVSMECFHRRDRCTFTLLKINFLAMFLTFVNRAVNHNQYAILRTCASSWLDQTVCYIKMQVFVSYYMLFKMYL